MPDRDTESDLTWRGVLDPHQLSDRLVATAHRLADAAKAGNWPAVFRMLDDP